ncbi:MAG TPA: pyridoxamine 5'-phosphate oxidase family protein [Acidimicrobiales bacterium]|nr:pyridoxamine 5'-phosphate oxidase family protein [Acidimicrobiales bacterium]
MTIDRIAAGDHYLAVIATTRADGSVQASVVNACTLPHPVSNERVVAFGTYGKTKLSNLRARPRGDGRLPNRMAHAQDGLAPGGTLLVVGHDASNLTHGYGGPQDRAVLFTSEEVAPTWTRCELCEPIMWNAASRPIRAPNLPSTRWCGR